MRGTPVRLCHPRSWVTHERQAHAKPWATLSNGGKFAVNQNAFSASPSSTLSPSLAQALGLWAFCIQNTRIKQNGAAAAAEQRGAAWHPDRRPSLAENEEGAHTLAPFTSEVPAPTSRSPQCVGAEPR